MNTRTAFAKAAYRLAGELSRVKTYQRFWFLDLDGDELLRKRHDGRHWAPCALSMRLLEWSENIDPQHWGHWALVHDDEPATKCEGCGGYVCTPKEYA